jgi:RimJ/RimL family protein N-acetyltransferase
MGKEIPKETVQAYARTICHEAKTYGFNRVDIIRLINALLDVSCNPGDLDARISESRDLLKKAELSAERFPLTSSRLQIRPAVLERDLALLEGWMGDSYGRHFLLSCATAQRPDITMLLSNASNLIGIVELKGGAAIGAVAFLDIDPVQKRAELRKLIGDKNSRGKGYAEEATALWIEYGLKQLSLEKVYVSTLQTHLRNIALNEGIGFRVEGVLRSELLIDGRRHDVLRMGLCLDDLD